VCWRDVECAAGTSAGGGGEAEEGGGSVEPEGTAAEPEPEPEPRPRPKGGETGMLTPNMKQQTPPKTHGNRCKQWQLKKMEQLPKKNLEGEVTKWSKKTTPPAQSPCTLRPERGPVFIKKD
jgi:hypothetical protein